MADSAPNPASADEPSSSGVGKRVLVLNGSNLNLLGRREPGIYGTATLDEVMADLTKLADRYGCELTSVQSNHEGVLVEAVHDAMDWADGILINPAGFTTTSVSLRDAILGVKLPTVELHLSNTHAREEFRHTSMLAPVCVGTVAGFGSASYRMALIGLLDHLGVET